MRISLCLMLYPHCANTCEYCVLLWHLLSMRHEYWCLNLNVCCPTNQHVLLGVARIIATVSAAGCLDLATLGGLTWGWGRIWPWMMDDWNTKVTKDDQMHGLFDKLWQSTGSKQFHIEVSLILGPAHMIFAAQSQELWRMARFQIPDPTMWAAWNQLRLPFWLGLHR